MRIPDGFKSTILLNKSYDLVRNNITQHECTIVSAASFVTEMRQLEVSNKRRPSKINYIIVK